MAVFVRRLELDRPCAARPRPRGHKLVHLGRGWCHLRQPVPHRRLGLSPDETADHALVASGRKRQGSTAPGRSPQTRGLASTSTFARTTSSARSATTFSRTGPRARHGPHHDAHRSTTTGTCIERSRTSASNVSSVTSIATVISPPVALLRPRGPRLSSTVGIASGSIVTFPNRTAWSTGWRELPARSALPLRAGRMTLASQELAPSSTPSGARASRAGSTPATRPPPPSPPCSESAPHEVVATFDADALLDHRSRRPALRISHGGTRPAHLARAAPSGRHRDGWAQPARAGRRPSPTSGGTSGAPRWWRWGCAWESSWWSGSGPSRRRCRTPGRSGSPPPPTATNWPARSASCPRPWKCPAGAQAVLEVAFGDAGVPSVGVWARVPHYAAGTPYPEAAAALLDELAR